jgi:hypothetical protein
VFAWKRRKIGYQTFWVKAKGAPLLPAAVWFVDPSARTIEVLSRGERGWMVTDTFGGEGEARIPPFDAVAFDIGALWDINSPAGQAT